jgi:hypothetical protein
MMSSYVTVVYVNCLSWHVHGSHLVCLLKPGVTIYSRGSDEMKIQILLFIKFRKAYNSIFCAQNIVDASKNS